MSKLFRALLLSAVATGAAAVVLKLIETEAPPAAPPRATGPYEDADAMTQEQRDALLQELDAQI